MTRVFLDANVLIRLFERTGVTASNQEGTDVLRRASAAFSDPDTVPAIAPLVRYEVLRHPKLHETSRHAELRAGLDGLLELDVSTEIADLAADLFRRDREAHRDEPSYNLEKRRFDTFHVDAAHVHGFELLSDDTHVRTLQGLIGASP